MNNGREQLQPKSLSKRDILQHPLINRTGKKQQKMGLTTVSIKNVLMERDRYLSEM